MNIAEIYECQEILDIAQNAITEKEKECDKLFKDPKTRELIVEEGERLKNMKNNLEQEIVENSHWIDNKQKVLENLKDSETVNTDNVAALNKIAADKLKDVSTETIAAFTKTIAQNPIDMSGNLDKYDVVNIIIKIGTTSLPNLKKAGLLDKLDEYDVLNLIIKIGITSLPDLKKVGLLDELNSNFYIKEIISSLGFNALSELCDYDLLEGLDLSYIQVIFAKELESYTSLKRATHL